MLYKAVPVILLLSVAGWAGVQEAPEETDGFVDGPILVGPELFISDPRTESPDVFDIIDVEPTGQAIGGGQPILVRDVYKTSGFETTALAGGTILFDNGDYLRWAAGCDADPLLDGTPGEGGCIVESGRIDARYAAAIADLVATPPLVDPLAFSNGVFAKIQVFGETPWTYEYHVPSKPEGGGPGLPLACDMETGNLSLCQALVATEAHAPLVAPPPKVGFRYPW